MKKGIDKVKNVCYTMYVKGEQMFALKEGLKKMKKFYVICDLKNGGLTTIYYDSLDEWSAYYRENKANIRKVIKCGVA